MDTDSEISYVIR